MTIRLTTLETCQHCDEWIEPGHEVEDVDYEFDGYSRIGYVHEWCFVAWQVGEKEREE